MGGLWRLNGPLMCAVRASRRRVPGYLRMMWNDTYTGSMTDLATIAGLTRPGDSIRERRIELGWTQAELAEQAGVAQADISRIENGRLDPRWSTIHRLSAALEATGVESKRSLANGGRGRSAPKRTGRRWAPKGPTVAIESSEA
jgi:DNA-binding XRE family transcriptional regulator